MTIDKQKDHIQEALTRSVDRVYPDTEALERMLLSGKRLRIYFGIDPTSPHLHVGHATGLLTLKRFQDLGHEVILLIGDFTARIGDPTDKLAARQPLTKEQVQEHLKPFKKQVSKILSFSGENPARIAYNSKWHEKMTFKDVISLASHFTVQQMIERDMFQRRLESQKPIWLHEFFYPLMQGYDSVALDVDMEIGGTDQIFNMLAGRTLMKVMLGKEKMVLAVKLLVDTKSGKKLSKTEETLINLDDDPVNMFGKAMAIPDEMIIPLAELATLMPRSALIALSKEENPRDAKLAVAFELVKLYHSEKDARKAQAYFITTFSKKEVSESIPELLVSERSLPLVDLILKTGVKSKSEAWRLITQGGISFNGKKITDTKTIIEPKDGIVLKVGKKKFFKLKTA